MSKEYSDTYSKKVDEAQLVLHSGSTVWNRHVHVYTCMYSPEGVRVHVQTCDGGVTGCSKLVILDHCES